MMARLALQFGLLLLLQVATDATPLCEEASRIILPNTSHVAHPVAHGLHFKEGTFWKENGTIYGCPCKFTRCLTLCHEAFDGDSHEQAMINVTELSGSLKTIPLKQFFLLPGRLPGENDTCHIFNKEDYEILSSGALKLLIYDQTIDHTQFCAFPKDGKVSAVQCRSPKTKSLSQTTPLSQVAIVYMATMGVSIFFLLLVVAAFFLLAEMRNLQGMCITCQCATLAAALLCLIFSYLYDRTYPLIMCQIVAFLGHYFMLSSFSWLTTISFNMYRTFSNLEEMAAASFKSIKNIRAYAIFSTFAPMLLTLTVVVLEYSLDPKSNKLWPGIGLNKCWFRGRTTEFSFYQGPLLLILICNAAFFFSTLSGIRKLQQEVAYLNSPNSGCNNNKRTETLNSFWLSLKLFLLMGGTWSMEFVSWAVQGTHVVWIVFDVINILRGPLFFHFCLVANARVRNAIIARIRSQPKNKQTNSTSTNLPSQFNSRNSSLRANQRTSTV